MTGTMHQQSVALFVSICTLLAAPAALAAPGPAGCGTGSWIGGTTEICDGVFVHRDYVYDDYGASVGDPSAPNSGSLSGTNGKVRYTADINSADLTALRLWIDGGQLHVRFELNTLRNASSTVAALAIDTDANALTGGGAWADLCAVEQPPGSGTCAVPLSSTGWEEVHLFETGDPATNRIEGAIPLPSGTTWRVQAVTGIQSRRIAMNVAFRGGIEDALTTSSQSGLWFEERQALALTSGDISQFGAVVDVSQLVTGVTEPAPIASGYHERVYTSDITVAAGPGGTFVYDQNAEGMDYAGIPAGAGSFDQSIKFYGKNQPYGIYIPQQPGPHGLQLALHGLGANHASLIARSGMQQNIGEALNRIVVVPLGRGPAGWYDEASERDVLDVLTDVTSNYDVDTDQVFSGGYSMGGYGGYRMATLYPDRFAGFIVWVGAHEGRSAKGIQVFDFLKNLRQVPGAMLYAGEDELVNITVYQDLQPRLEALAYENILYFHPAAEHLTFAVAQNWNKEAAWSAGRTLQKQPKQVTYRTEPFTWNESIGVIHDKAYWVSEIRGVNTGSSNYVDVDILTSGCGGSLPLTTRTTPDPVGTDPVAWTAQEFTVTGQQPIAPQNRIDATLANVASLEINTSDFTGACIAGDLIDYEITTDGATQVAFSDGSTLDFPGAGVYTGTLPEPGLASSLAAGALLIVALARCRHR
jgi:dienelactone hydrolase